MKDNGLGMDEEAVTRAFEPFSRLGERNKLHTTSNGVGLSICKRICHQLGGDIEAVSKLGVGSTFIFSVKAKSY